MFKVGRAVWNIEVNSLDTCSIHYQTNERWAGEGVSTWPPVRPRCRLKPHRSHCNLFINSTKN